MNFKIQKFTTEKTIMLPRHEVWEMLSDTDHLNRVIGLFPVNFNEVNSSNQGVHRKAFSKAIGIMPMRWEEYPFEWEKNQYYSVLRIYTQGPLKRFFAGLELNDEELPSGELGTRVKLFANIIPRNVLGFLAAPMIGKSSMKKTHQYLLDYKKSKEQGKINPIPQTKLKYKVNLIELNLLLEKLKQMPIDHACIDLFRNHLLHHGDDEVIDMRPYVIAELWQISKAEVLLFFLHTSKLGIVNLNWHLLCPNCRVSKSTANSLDRLQRNYHCDFCGIDYKTSFDQYVELCFSIHPIIRKAYKETFCIGGPALTPHIYSQTNVQANSTTNIHLPTELGDFRIRVLRTNHTIHVLKSSEDVIKTSERSPIIYNAKGWEQDEVSCKKTEDYVVIHNDSNQDIMIVFEDLGNNHNVVTAAKLMTIPGFRDLFSSEVLAPGHEVSFENVTIFFSDLKDSTHFYETVGDAHAYGQVRQHFDFITYWVHKSQGSIVKTIGDAVMAVFESPEQGIEASLNIQANIDVYNKDRLEYEAIIIKIGLHTGPAIAVNFNDRLDYFGRTVNIAARIQDLSSGGDILLSQTCMDRQGVRELIKQYDAKPTHFKSALKGIQLKEAVTRVIC